MDSQEILLIQKSFKDEALHIEMGKFYHRQGEATLAIAELKKAIEVNPNNEFAHFEIGNLYLSTRNEPDAERAYKKALGLNPHFSHAALELGKLYYYRHRRNDLAIAQFNEVISAFPADWEANYLLGKIYKERQDYKLAIEKLERACEADNDREQIYFELGKAYRDIDMPDLAVKQFDKVLTIGNNRDNTFIKNKVLNEIEIVQKKIVLESKVRAMVAMILNRCNLKCVICNIWKTPWQASERTMDEIVKLFPYIEDMVWEGGEVLLMKGFGEVLEEAFKYSHMKQVIFTNGLVFTEKIIEKLVHGRVDIVFSIDGASKETYEKIRRGGKFERLLKNLGMIKKAKERSGGCISTYFNSIIMKSNYRELEKIIDFAKEYNFNAVTITPIRGNFGEENIFENNDVTALGYIKNTIPEITKKAYEYGLILNNWLPGMQTGCCASVGRDNNCKIPDTGANTASPDKTNNRIICLAPWQRLVIDSEGQVRPFVFCLNKWVGNTDKSSLDEIWNGKAMQEYRKRILAQDYNNLCQPECISGQVADKIRDIII